ncbi:MAG: hypothetical protein WBC91_22905, partial [Phototrophicaceae bacterium]
YRSSQVASIEAVIGADEDDNAVRIYDFETTTLLHTLDDFNDFVFGVKFNPDGTILATAGGDQIIQFWQVLADD